MIVPLNSLEDTRCVRASVSRLQWWCLCDIHKIMMVSVTSGHYCVNTVTIINTNLSAGQVMDPMRETLSCRWLVDMEPVQMGWGAWHQATGGELCRPGGTEWQSALSTPCQIRVNKTGFPSIRQFTAQAPSCALCKMSVQESKDWSLCSEQAAINFPGLLVDVYQDGSFAQN